MNIIKNSTLILLLSIMSGQINLSLANVQPAKIFGSNMVLQKGIENTIWGQAVKNEAISITIHGKTVRTKAGKTGKWIVKLPVMDYGGPYTLKINGKNSIEMTNVMIGEVWFSSGQSNMECQVYLAENAKEEIANANYPQIRLFSVPKKISQFPVGDIEKGEWTECSPKTVADFSAVAYFFGRKIHKDLNVAVGLINAPWGGTVAETWISSETIKNDPDFIATWNKLQKIDWSLYLAQEEQRIKTILGEVPLKDNGVSQGFNLPGLDDSAWKTVKSPMCWENQGYVELNGIAWYRKSFDLTKDQASSKLLLSLAKIDDSDICWVNGVEVGSSEKFNMDRKYEVPASALREGKNSIAVRVSDHGGFGGIYGSEEDLFAQSGNIKINLSGDWKFKFSEVNLRNTEPGPNDYPTLLYNGMINPIIPYGIRGVIWYQGEGNTPRAKQYQRIFPGLITDWRNKWKLGDFPFIWVQLANFLKPDEEPSESTWAELREAQTMTLKLPNTGMASAIDIGDANDIHPKNKQDVGKRLALNALKLTYGKDIVYQGPMFSKVEFNNGKAVVSFSNTGGGLMAKDRYGYVKGFALAGADKKFYWARAQIINKTQVEVSCDKVSAPKEIRYGWADNPGDVNLYNNECLPANPFRTNGTN